MKPTLILPSMLCCLSAMTAAEKKPYNVVFIISDQHKTTVTGCYGDELVKTPNIDALALTGVRFTHMYTASPLSAPARASLMTGVDPNSHGVLTHFLTIERDDKKIVTGPGKYPVGYDGSLVTWGEYFKSLNYTTAAVGKMHVHGELQKGASKEKPEGNLMGFDYSDMRLYSSFPGGHYRDHKNNPDINDRYREINAYDSIRRSNHFNQALHTTLVEKEEDVFDFLVAKKSNAYIEQCVKEGKPFVIHVGLEKPHKPWTTFQRFYDMYSLDDIKLPVTLNDTKENGRYPYVRKPTQNKPETEEEVKRSMLAYYSCVTQMDEAVGRVVKKVKDLGIYENTIFVYTSDHGEHLYEHGFQEKHNMYEAAVNVPFIISCPALLPQGVVCPSYASLIDVLPTLSELVGGAPLKQWEGQSLISQIGAKKPWNRTIFSEIGVDDFLPFNPKIDIPLRMLLDGTYKFVYTHGMIDQLYCVAKDSFEMNNLALDSKYDQTIYKYRLRTLSGWNPFGMKNIEVKAKRNEQHKLIITIPGNKQISKYTVWASSTPDVDDAVLIGEVNASADGNTVTLPAKKNVQFIWVMAHWNLTKNGERKINVPMTTEKYPDFLPVSAKIKI